MKNKHLLNALSFADPHACRQVFAHKPRVGRSLYRGPAHFLSRRQVCSRCATRPQPPRFSPSSALLPSPDSFAFDPFDLDIDITPDNVRKVAADGEYTKALVMSFRLSEQAVIHEVVETVPAADVALVVETLPVVYIEKMLAFAATQIDSSPHIGLF